MIGIQARYECCCCSCIIFIKICRNISDMSEPGITTIRQQLYFIDRIVAFTTHLSILEEISMSIHREFFFNSNLILRHHHQRYKEWNSFLVTFRRLLFITPSVAFPPFTRGVFLFLLSLVLNHIRLCL